MFPRFSRNPPNKQERVTWWCRLGNFGGTHGENPPGQAAYSIIDGNEICCESRCDAAKFMGQKAMDLGNGLFLE